MLYSLRRILSELLSKCFMAVGPVRHFGEKDKPALNCHMWFGVLRFVLCRSNVTGDNAQNATSRCTKSGSS